MTERGLMLLSAVAFAIAVVLLFAGCTVAQFERGAVRAEHVLTALSSDWEQRLDAEIERCSVHPPGVARDACIAPAEHVDNGVAASEHAAVAALRSFWLGVAVKADPRDLAKHLAELQRAIAGFPVDAMRQLGGSP
jgi:hypothetical protein